MNHCHPKITSKILNPYMVKQQGLSKDDINKIVELHETLHAIFNQMETLDPEKDQVALKACGAQIEELEFQLQDAWGWKQNADLHTWWFKSPHCCCGFFDNMERLGTPYRVINDGCPVHKII